MARRISVVSPLAIIVLLISSLGVTPAAAMQESTSDHTLRIEYNHYPDTLDPQLMYDINQDMVAGLVFEGLTRVDEELNIVPAAAESWEFSPDGLTLTFRLRDALVYSDGTPLTAERFRYAIERTCDPRLESMNASMLFEIVGCQAFFDSLQLDETDDTASPVAATLEEPRSRLGVRAIDDRTLEIQLIKPAVYFPALASMSMFFPAKREFIEAGGEEWWRDPANMVGNGPFRLASLPPEGGNPTKIVFAANEHYWGGRPALDTIEYVHYAEPRTAEDRLEQYRRGDLDMVWLAWEAFPAVEADPELSQDIVQTPRAATIHMTLNTNREPFTDRKVREAFAYGFDREGYCREIQYGFCQPALSWVPAGIPGAIETDAFAFDPVKARQALADSSYGGPDALPEITWYYGEGNSEAEAEARWFAEQYRAVLGIELSLVPLTDDEWDSLYESAESWPQLSTNGWFGAYPDPQYWLSVVWTCDSTAHASRVGYCNPELDDLLQRADAEQDATARIALYEEAGRMLVADVPSIFMLNWAEAVLVKPEVTGFAMTVMDHWPGWTTPLTIDVQRPA